MVKNLLFNLFNEQYENKNLFFKLVYLFLIKISKQYKKNIIILLDYHLIYHAMKINSYYDWLKTCFFKTCLVTILKKK